MFVPLLADDTNNTDTDNTDANTIENTDISVELAVLRDDTHTDDDNTDDNNITIMTILSLLAILTYPWSLQAGISGLNSRGSNRGSAAWVLKSNSH